MGVGINCQLPKTFIKMTLEELKKHREDFLHKKEILENDRLLLNVWIDGYARHHAKYSIGMLYEYKDKLYHVADITLDNDLEIKYVIRELFKDYITDYEILEKDFGENVPLPISTDLVNAHRLKQLNKESLRHKEKCESIENICNILLEYYINTKLL